jgi:hypothetical protein
MTRDEANGWLVNTLLEKIRNDRYPSATQMSMVEDVIPRDMVADYLQVLMDKAAEDKVPSVPMLQRIMRVAASLPATEPRPPSDGDRDEDDEQ